MFMNANEPAAAGFRPVPGTLNSDVPPRSDAELAMIDAHLRQLAELREIGMRLARDVEDDPPQGQKPPPKAGLLQAYAQLTKAIRQIMALEQEVIGLREKRAVRNRQVWLKDKVETVRRSVEKSLTAAKPEMTKPSRERLLSDLFRDYNDYQKGPVRDLVADICKTLGVEADLSLWDEPQPAADIVLPAGHEWIVPANGDKPYTVVETQAGYRVGHPFDSPHLKQDRAAAPDG
jgi:hypothetical protein